jgi:hypothetical protein
MESAKDRFKNVPWRCQVPVREYRSGCELGREADFSWLIINAEAVDLLANTGRESRERVLSILDIIRTDKLFEYLSLIDSNFVGSSGSQKINRSVVMW